MHDAVLKLWPEIAWIKEPELREQVISTWQKALKRSPLTADDLNRIPFTLLVPNCQTTFMEHKRCVVHIASKRGELLRHPFTGVALAMECGVPDAVCHIIATHAAEGDLVKRTTEACIVHHADFMAYLPFKNLGKQ